MKQLLNYIAILCLTLGTIACGDDNKPDDWWNQGGGSEKPENPDTPTPDEPTTEEDGSKPRYVWIDASGNFEQFANSQDNIVAELKKIKDMGFTDVVVDVRPTTGDVLFKSSVADPVTKMDAWTNSGYVWLERTATWDYLQTFVDEGHKLGLRVNASIITFGGGYLCPYNLGSIGMLYRDSTKKKWATVLNTADGLVSSMDLQDAETAWGAKFLNPANDEVQEYILQIISDLAQYDIDGIILDRCRYDDYLLKCDFSDESRAKFEQFIGKPVSNFPGDIMPAGTALYPDYETTWYKDWLAFRVKVIHDFIVKARKTVKDINPKIKFGCYVGAWYSDYYLNGVNWASPKYNPATEFPEWANSKYQEYGYADHLDYLFIGAYAGSDDIYGNGEWTVQGFCIQAGKKLKGDVPYIGGPDIGNGTGWADGGKAARIPDAIDACINNSDGMFLFDLCHIRMHNYWDACKQGIDKYLSTVK